MCFACTDKKPVLKSTPSSTLKYAKGFWIEDKGAYRNLFIRHSADTSIAPIQYRLVKTISGTSSSDGALIIQVPIKNMVCTSTTHIPLLDYLGDSKKLIGFPSTKYISSPITRQRIDSGFVKELGKENGLNLELLTELQPSIVMAYSMGKDLGQLKKVQELGIPVVINSEYLEQHPLGRAEWIKFMALFLGKEDKADSIFNWIESEYQNAKSSIRDTLNKPTVLTGIPYGGIWYLPGGKNYAAQFFKDAGCQYLWSDEPSSGFLQLSLETVYEKALSAEYWIGIGSFESYNELKSTDERFAKFNAWQTKNAFTYNSRIGATGGNEYLELGYLRPDLILKDIIKITHPNQVSSHELFFFKELKRE